MPQNLAISHHTLAYLTTPYNTLQRVAVLCETLQYPIIPYNRVPCCTVSDNNFQNPLQYIEVPHSALQHFTFPESKSQNVFLFALAFPCTLPLGCVCVCACARARARRSAVQILESYYEAIRSTAMTDLVSMCFSCPLCGLMSLI